MKRKNIRFISIVLAIVLGFGTLMAVPAVYAETKKVSAKQVEIKKGPTKQENNTKRIFTPADTANLVILKELYKQIGETAKLISEKVKAAKINGKDLSAFTADLKLAQKYITHKAASHGIMLTEAERTTLATMQTSIKTLEQQLKTQREAKVAKAILEAIKAQIKAAIKTRNAYLKTIHSTALTDYSTRLETQIADARTKLTFMQGLLNRLP